MVCSIVKKSLLGAALGAGGLFLVFGTAAPSYVKTAFHKVRQNVKDSVDPQFEIERARRDIDSLQPMFDQNKETLARAEIDAEKLDAKIGEVQASLEKDKGTILALQQKLKTGDFRLTGHVSYTADELKSELAGKLDRYDSNSELLHQKQETLKAKRKVIQAGREQLQNLKIQKLSLLSKLDNLEAKLKMMEATQTKNEFNFDGSALSRAKETVSDLEHKLAVMARRADIDNQFGDVDQPGVSLVDPRRDVLKEVDEKFGPSSRPAGKSGDKSL